MGKLNLKPAEQIRVQLTLKQQKQIEQIYKGVAKDIDQRVKKIPNVSSAPLQKYYLENLKKQVLDELNKASSGLQDMIEGNMKSVAESVIDSTLDFAQKVGLSVEGLYSHVPDDVVKAVATGQLYDGDWTLSKAIWKDHMKTQYNVNTVVAKGIAENKSAYDIAKDLEKYVDPSAAKDWDWSKVYPGVGKKIDYNAQRLARTMVSHAYQQAFVRSTIKNPFVEMYRWDASNSARVCPICADRDGQLFSKNDLPLDHPNGMCTFEAVIPDSMEDIADRVADWAYGADDPELDGWAEDLTGLKWEPSFNKEQEKWLGNHGWSPTSMPTNFKSFAQSLTFDEQEQLLKLAGGSWNDAHPYQKMEQYYLKNLAVVREVAKPKVPSVSTLVNQHNIPNVPDYSTWIKLMQKQTESYMLDLESKAFDKMTPEEKSALRTYTGSAYRDMNSYLRKLAVGDSATTKYKSEIDLCMQALKKSNFEDTLVLRRGTDFGDLAGLIGGDFMSTKTKLSKMSIKELRDTYVGLKGKYAGFTSTSSDFEKGFSGNVEMIFYAPKGTQGSSIMGISKFGTDEGETLLNAGTQVEIVGIEDSDGHFGSSVRIFLRILEK